MKQCACRACDPTLLKYWDNRKVPYWTQDTKAKLVFEQMRKDSHCHLVSLVGKQHFPPGHGCNGLFSTICTHELNSQWCPEVLSPALGKSRYGIAQSMLNDKTVLAMPFNGGEIFIKCMCDACEDDVERMTQGSESCSAVKSVSFIPCPAFINTTNARQYRKWQSTTQHVNFGIKMNASSRREETSVRISMGPKLGNVCSLLLLLLLLRLGTRTAWTGPPTAQRWLLFIEVKNSQCEGGGESQRQRRRAGLYAGVGMEGLVQAEAVRPGEGEEFPYGSGLNSHARLPISGMPAPRVEHHDDVEPAG
eukprot:760749-Hanusia_phi.AAC.7